jgi:hypothetical protein
MTLKEIKSRVESGLISNSFYKLKTIDGNDGSSDSEYFETKEEAESEAEGIESPYFFEISKVSFKLESIRTT